MVDNGKNKSVDARDLEFASILWKAEKNSWGEDKEKNSDIKGNENTHL
jgi:hypothetical protein